MHTLPYPVRYIDQGYGVRDEIYSLILSNASRAEVLLNMHPPAQRRCVAVDNQPPDTHFCTVCFNEKEVPQWSERVRPKNLLQFHHRLPAMTQKILSSRVPPRPTRKSIGSTDTM
jgi:hypothetical protein